MSASTSTSTSALPTRRQALRQLPSSVRTAGTQPGSSPAQCAPLDVNLGRSQLSEHIAEDMPDRTPEDLPDSMPEDMPDKMPEDM